MPYLISNGKRVVSAANSGKYITGINPIQPLFAGWTNISWDTFSSSGQNISSAIKSTAAFARADTEQLPFIAGDVIKIDYLLTLNSGSYPTNTAEIHLIHEYMGIVATNTLFPGMALSTSINILTQPISMNFRLRFQNYDKITAHIVDCSCQFVIFKE